MNVTRRSFAAGLAASGFALKAAEPRPNILWISCEDIGPHLGAYGDKYSVSPNLDKLAARGTRYNYAWSNAPVCAPARTTIITGMYPPSTGAEHMRSMTHLPEGMKLFPCYLREAGYYTANNVKEDYNVEHTGTVWDESSNKAHWRNRKAGQPFFSVFNIVTTHESQIHKRPHTAVHDPAKARVPAYHPDAPEVRRDWAQYYDNITTMDGQAGRILADLEKDGLADDTVIVFFGDHGPGMPRCKRYPYNSGLRVPLLAHVPAKYRGLLSKDYQPGGASDRLVGFIDLAPTMLSLAGIAAPAHMQGSAFLGKHIGQERQYNYGFRGRMDERYDMMRTVSDRRYVYIRNYMPHKPYGQHVATMFEMPTTQVWKKLYDEGKLNAAQRHFWERKPAEELYDLAQDRDEVNNLAGSPAHSETLAKMRKAQRDLAAGICDVGFLPEGEIHKRAAGSSPYEVGHDEKRYPAARIMETAELAAGLKPEATAKLIERLGDADSAVRYWAASGILMRGAEEVKAAAGALRKALGDQGPYVRAVAAEALATYGGEDDLKKSLDVLLDLVDAGKHGVYVSVWALIAIDTLGAKAKPIAAALAQVNLEDKTAPKRLQPYNGRLMAKIKKDLAS